MANRLNDKVIVCPWLNVFCFFQRISCKEQGMAVEEGMARESDWKITSIKMDGSEYCGIIEGIGRDGVK